MDPRSKTAHPLQAYTENTEWRQWWDWLVSVEVDDPEERRLGRLFNIVALIGLGVLIVWIVLLSIVGSQGLDVNAQANSGGLFVALLFPVLLLISSVLSIGMAKRGQVRQAISFYVWLYYIAISAACLLFGGTMSSGWVLYFWPIIIAGVLMAPQYAVWLSFGVLGYYLVLVFFAQLGLYSAPFAFGLEQSASVRVTQISSIGAVLIMLIAAGGGVTYLAMKSSRAALALLQSTKEALEQAHWMLEERVISRTTVLNRRVDQFRKIAEFNREAMLTAATSGRLTDGRPTDLDTLLSSSVALISERFGFYHTGIFLLDEAGDLAVLRAAYSEQGQRLLEQGYQVGIADSGVVGYAVRTGRSRIASNVEHIPDSERAPKPECQGAAGPECQAEVGPECQDEVGPSVELSSPDFVLARSAMPETRCQMALPLESRGRIIGVLDIHSRKENAFTEEDSTALQILADNLAVVIENTALLTESREIVEQLKRYQQKEIVNAWRQALARRNLRLDYMYTQRGGVRLAEIGGEAEGAAGKPSAERATDSKTERTKTKSDSPPRPERSGLEDRRCGGEANRGTRQDGTCQGEAGREVGSSVNGSRQTVDGGQGAERAKTKSGDMYPLDISVHTVAQTVHTVVQEGGNELLLAPVVVQGRTVGVLSFEGQRPWRNDEVQLAQTVVEQLGLALENARLLEESRVRALQEQARSEIVSQVRVLGSVDAILRSAAQQLGRALKVERSRIQLAPEEDLQGGDEETG